MGTDLLSHLALFEDMSPDRLEALIQLAGIEDYPQGAILFNENDPAGEFSIILDGEVEIIYQHPAGGEILLDHGKPGETFGEAALVHAALRNA